MVEVCPGEGTKPSDISVITEVSEELQDVDMQRRHALSKLASMRVNYNVLDTRIYSDILFFFINFVKVNKSQ